MLTSAARTAATVALGLSVAVVAADQGGKEPPKEIKNSIEMQLVMIPAGEFLMGNEDSYESLKKAFPEMPLPHFRTSSTPRSDHAEFLRGNS